MGQPRYAFVAQSIIEKINLGEYPVGSLLPTEHKLCEIYEVSRHTIRSALREIQELGLISRHKRTGTEVIATAVPSGFRQSLSSLDDLAQFSATHIRHVKEITDVVVDQELTKELNLPLGSRWIRISSVRLDIDAKNAPIGWTDVYIEAQYSEIKNSLKTTPDALISALIEKKYGRCIAEIRQMISATEVPPNIAEELKVSIGASALKIIRHYIDNAGKTFESTISYHPSDKFSMTMILKRVQPS